MSNRLNRLDLTDINLDLECKLFKKIVRIDDLLFSSKITTADQVSYLQNMSVKLVIDLKNKNETEFEDEKVFTEAGIKYLNYPITNIENVSFEMLCRIKNEIENSNDHKLIYCMSGNRVGALFTLILSEVLGHPKERAFEYGCKVGMNKEELMEKVKNRINFKERIA